MEVNIFHFMDAFIYMIYQIIICFQNDYDSMDYTEYNHSPHHPGTTPERPSSRSSQQQLRAAHPGWYPPPPPHMMPPFPPAPPALVHKINMFLPLATQGTYQKVEFKLALIKTLIS